MVLLAFAESVQLVPDGTLFIHIGLILLMIYILNRTFFRPVNRVLEARDKNKAGGSEAQTLLSEVSEKETRYSEAIREARSKGYELIEQTRAQAVSVKQERLSATRAQTDEMLATETANIQQQTVAARQAIASEAEKLADKISANILKA